MEPQLCIKMSYNKQIQYIICDAYGSSYEHIMAIANARFNVPQEHQNAMMLTNDHGYIFEKQLFEYFLLLFPNPELIFYLRPNWRKLRSNATVKQVTVKSSASVTGTPANEAPPAAMLRRTQSSKNFANDVHSQVDEPPMDYIPVPVYRQNCFCGTMPTVNLKRTANDEEDADGVASKRFCLTMSTARAKTTSKLSERGNSSNNNSKRCIRI